MTTLLQRLVAHAARHRYETLSPATVAAARRALLDALGCGIAALGCDPATIAARATPPQDGPVTVYGEAATQSVERAALLNGILVRYLDMMDVYSANDICHPAENVPLALAAVEHAGGNGRTLIEAIVAGYEAQLRMTHALSLTGMGMHHVSAAGLVAPIVIGTAWRVSEAHMEQAAALSGVRGFALHALSKGGLSMAKALGYPWAAMDAVLAVRLAQQGCTGPVGLLDWLVTEGPMKNTATPDAIDAPRAAPLVERVSFKQFPIQFELQTPVALALDLHAQMAGRAIANLAIHTRPATLKRTADPAKFAPDNRETADHSLPVCVAMALLDGALTAHAFESGRWKDADVKQLVSRTQAIGDEALERDHPGGRPARVVVTLADGSVLEAFAAAPLGDVTRPMDDATLAAKFTANVAPVWGAARAAAILDAVRAIEHCADVREFTRLLRP